jgi:hypothetical protein
MKIPFLYIYSLFICQLSVLIIYRSVHISIVLLAVIKEITAYSAMCFM